MRFYAEGMKFILNKLHARMRVDLLRVLIAYITHLLIQ